MIHKKHVTNSKRGVSVGMAKIKTKKISGPKGDLTPDKELEDFVYEINRSGGKIIDIKTNYFDSHRGNMSVRRYNDKLISWIEFIIYYEI